MDSQVGEGDDAFGFDLFDDAPSAPRADYGERFSSLQTTIEVPSEDGTEVAASSKRAEHEVFSFGQHSGEEAMEAEDCAACTSSAEALQTLALTHRSNVLQALVSVFIRLVVC